MAPNAGWPYPFKTLPWAEIVASLQRTADGHPEFTHMVQIAQSVVATGSEDALAGCTSMRDILVVPAPVPEPPYSIIHVHAPGSLREHRADRVLITHLSLTGREEAIERPVTDAVPLFWRFVIEKFGVHPSRPLS